MWKLSLCMCACHSPKLEFLYFLSGKTLDRDYIETHTHTHTHTQRQEMTSVIVNVEEMEL